MPMKKCQLCGSIIPDYGIDFCVECSENLDHQFSLVRDFLYDYPNAPIEEVAEATGVPHKAIVYFLKDGRLRIANATGMLRCEQCGEAIDSGRYCAKCTQRFDERMVKPFLDAQKRARERGGGPRMHTERS